MNWAAIVSRVPQVVRTVSTAVGALGGVAGAISTAKGVLGIFIKNKSTGEEVKVGEKPQRFSFSHSNGILTIGVDLDSDGRKTIEIKIDVMEIPSEVRHEMQAHIEEQEAGQESDPAVG